MTTQDLRELSSEDLLEEFEHKAHEQQEEIRLEDMDNFTLLRCYRGVCSNIFCGSEFGKRQKTKDFEQVLFWEIHKRMKKDARNEG